MAAQPLCTQTRQPSVRVQDGDVQGHAVGATEASGQHVAHPAGHHGGLGQIPELGGVRRYEVQEGARGVVRGLPPQSDDDLQPAQPMLVPGLGRDVPQHVRHHQARVHAMHPDAGALGLQPQRLGELADPTLARRIRVLQRHRPLVAVAVDVDEVAATLAEEHGNATLDPWNVPRMFVRTTRVKSSTGVDAVGPKTPEAPALLTQMSSVPRLRASSRRASTSASSPVSQLTPGRRDPFRLQPLDGGRDVGVRPGRQHHRRTLMPQQPGHGKPQAARRASHDCHASAEDISSRTHASLIRAAAGESKSAGMVKVPRWLSAGWFPGGAVPSHRGNYRGLSGRRGRI